MRFAQNCDLAFLLSITVRELPNWRIGHFSFNTTLEPRRHRPASALRSSVTYGHQDYRQSFEFIMNRCLQIPEILRLICDQIPSSTAFGRHRLYITALACRAFLEPALDSLWYSIHDLKPIIACLPQGLLKDQARTNNIAVTFSVLVCLLPLMTTIQ